MFTERIKLSLICSSDCCKWSKMRKKTLVGLGQLEWLRWLFENWGHLWTNPIRQFLFIYLKKFHIKALNQSAAKSKTFLFTIGFLRNKLSGFFNVDLWKAQRLKVLCEGPLTILIISRIIVHKCACFVKPRPSCWRVIMKDWACLEIVQMQYWGFSCSMLSRRHKISGRKTNIHKFEPADCRTRSRANGWNGNRAAPTTMPDDGYIFFHFSQNGMIAAQVHRRFYAPT